MGGGRAEFRNVTIKDEEEGFGKRHDGRDLINEWLLKDNSSGKRSYVWNTVSKILPFSQNYKNKINLHVHI